MVYKIFAKATIPYWHAKITGFWENRYCISLTNRAFRLQNLHFTYKSCISDYKLAFQLQKSHFVLQMRLLGLQFSLISRAADHENCEITAAAHLNFEDSLDISEFAADAVKRCVGAGMIQGDENNMFRPKASITRAECAKIIFCLINLIS